MNKHGIKRFVQKIALYFFRLGANKESEPTNEYEKECFAICSRLVHDPENTLLMSPISGKRYIRGDNDQIFVIMEKGLITIVNHQYSYNINLWGKAYERIERLFDLEIEKRRTAMEEEIKSNVKHSLSNIYKALQHEKV